MAKASKHPQQLLQELVELEPRALGLDQIFLDPNNPRFADTKLTETPLEKISEKEVQEKAMERMSKESLGELKENIKEVGFLFIDRVVVRKFARDKFVVVEGNRRIASLKQLQAEHRAGEISLPEATLGRLGSLQVLEYTGQRSDIAWIVQGIRHISSIRAWPPYQQARFVVELSEKQKEQILEIARMLGMKQSEVASMIRAYHGFAQIEQHEEYSDQIDPEYFAMLSEGVFPRPALKNWLGWNEKKQQFENEENLSSFLGMITPGPNGKALITRAIDVRDVLAPIVDPDDNSNHDLFQDLVEGKRSLDDCRAEVATRKFQKQKESEASEVGPLKAELKRIAGRLSTIPVYPILQQPAEAEEIAKLLAQIAQNANFNMQLLAPKVGRGA